MSKLKNGPGTCIDGCLQRHLIGGVAPGGGRWRLAAHVRGAAARDGRLWPSLASALSSGLPVHLMQWMAAKRCVAVAANAGTTVCTAGTWNSPTPGQALLGTALHHAAAGLRCAIPPRLSIQPDMEPGRLRRWRPHQGRHPALPCPALVPARLDGPPRYARPVRQPSFHPLHSATYSSWTSIGIHARPTGQRERVESTLGASSPSNSSRLPPHDPQLAR